MLAASWKTWATLSTGRSAAFSWSAPGMRQGIGADQLVLLDGGHEHGSQESVRLCCHETETPLSRSFARHPRTIGVSMRLNGMISKPVVIQSAPVRPLSPLGNVGEDQALVLGEVCVVLGVEGGEGESFNDAAGGDPGVVDRSWASTKLASGLEVSPGAGHAVVDRQDHDTLLPLGQPRSALWSPASDFCPFGEFAEGNEGDADRLGG
jgi:hypothetical protein